MYFILWLKLLGCCIKEQDQDYQDFFSLVVKFREGLWEFNFSGTPLLDFALLKHKQFPKFTAVIMLPSPNKATGD